MDDKLAQISYCAYVRGYCKAATKSPIELAGPTDPETAKFKVWFCNYRAFALGIRHGLLAKSNQAKEELSWPQFRETFFPQILADAGDDE
jgi:hypothetical protein